MWQDSSFYPSGKSSWQSVCLSPGTMYFLFIYSFIYFRHMEVPRLGAELELQLQAHTTATATPDPSHVYYLHHSSGQRQILNPLSKARDRTCILMDAGRVH